MTHEPRFPVYGPGRGLKAAGGGGVAVGIPIVGLGLMAGAGVGGVVLAVWTVIFVVAMTLAYVALRRSGTTTHPDHIEVRTPFRTRRTAWRDIKAIEIIGSGRTGRFVVIRNSSGGRTGLVHVNSRLITSLPDEVHRLRALWTRLRGPDWRP